MIDVFMFVMICLNNILLFVKDEGCIGYVEDLNVEIKNLCIVVKEVVWKVM